MELNKKCIAFNKRFVPAEDWDAENICGISAKAEDWLERNFDFGDGFSSYNGDSALSQVIQGNWLESNNGNKYLLLQIHQGCDVRGGYTDAKLFCVPKYEDGCMFEDVYGIVTRENGQEIQVDNRYDGYNLTDESGAKVEIGEKDKVELWLMEY